MNTASTVWLNGHFLPAAEATVSVFDRSFLYGDGLFETIRVYGGRPFLWAEHLRRLHEGADFLNIRIPHTDAELAAAVGELVRRNVLPESTLRLHLTRGVGPRGYSPAAADAPALVMTLHGAEKHSPDRPVRWRLITSSFRLPAGDPLTSFKTANKLVQVLARAEAEARGANEALLLNTAGHVTEATGSNVFWIENGTVCTPPLSAGLLAGVTRGHVLHLARQLGLPTEERDCQPGELLAAQGVFLTNSHHEIQPAVCLDGVPLRESPITQRLHRTYQDAVSKSVIGLPNNAAKPTKPESA